MRVVVQRVLRGACNVEGKEVSAIGKGYVCLVGISHRTTREEVDWMAGKVSKLRLFPNAKGQEWRASPVDLGYEMLLISQFTLHCELSGNKPSYQRAMGFTNAQVVFEHFCKQVKKAFGEVEEGKEESKVKVGVFGADMQIDLTNDGPVTVILEAPASFQYNGDDESIPIKKRNKLFFPPAEE